ncbi:MAG: hypothetical protein ACRDZT_05635 [Acidimicrobiales bacterium]
MHDSTGGVADAGDVIEQLLEELGSLPDRRARVLAERLVQVVTDFYGAGLERMVELASATAPGWLDELAGDPLVGSLLVLHDLHPLDVRERVERALGALRLSPGSGDVRLLELDEATGKVRVRLLVSALGAATAERRTREAIERAAPELSGIEIDSPTEIARPVTKVPVTLQPTRPRANDPAAATVSATSVAGAAR